VSRTYYTRLLDDVFVDVKRIINDRSHPETDLSWIIRDNTASYPDYFIVKTFGRNSFESKINSFLYSVAPVLWKRFIWKRMCRKMCSHVRDEHVKRFDLPLHDKKLFINVCYQHLYKNWKFWGTATFSDIFIFIALFLQKFSEDVLKTPDRFKEIKVDQNEKMLTLVNEIIEDLLQHPQATGIMAYLAIKGNWMDVFENDPNAFFIAFSEEVNELMDSEEILTTHKVNNDFFHLDQFLSVIEGKPKKILYECDNSGEVVLDLLFIEHLLSMGHSITITTKVRPFLNDVLDTEIKELIIKNFPTLSEALETKKITLLSHDLAFAGKIFSESKGDYINAVTESDFMIAKGQGHFQMMPMVDLINTKKAMPYTLPVFYLFGVRADIIYWCCNALFKTTKPEKGSVMLYAYNLANISSHPS